MRDAAQFRESGRLDDPGDWRRALPTLKGKRVVLRDLHTSDAASLQALLTTPEVSRFLYQPPSSVEGFERFIAWSQLQRSEGVGVCFALTLPDFDTAAGIFQVRAIGQELGVSEHAGLEPSFSVAEWGFALGAPLWGTGAFREAADLVLEFAFEVLRVHRLEATAAVKNGRGNHALMKLGAVQEGVLRRSLFSNNQYLDEALYSILEDDWRRSRLQHLQTERRDVH
jgi:ribosomal-protein-alanine N-acetyltransferase